MDDVVYGKEDSIVATPAGTPQPQDAHSGMFLFDCHRCGRTGHVASSCPLSYCKKCRGFVGHNTSNHKN